MFLVQNYKKKTRTVFPLVHVVLVLKNIYCIYNFLVFNKFLIQVSVCGIFHWNLSLESFTPCLSIFGLHIGLVRQNTTITPVVSRSRSPRVQNVVVSYIFGTLIGHTSTSSPVPSGYFSKWRLFRQFKKYPVSLGDKVEHAFVNI